MINVNFIRNSVFFTKEKHQLLITLSDTRVGMRKEAILTKMDVH
jgi:hypothetical protein